MSRTDSVVEAITARILDGELAAGSRLPVEKDLAELLGVSRGSLREGVRALCALGVLETRQGDGTYVTSLDPTLLIAPLGLVVELQGSGHALHLHAVRRLLETEAAGLAAAVREPDALGRARAALDRTVADQDHEAAMDQDVTFHRALAQAGGNPVLAALVDALGGRTARHRLWRAVAEAGAQERTRLEHEAIWTAVQAGDVERARVRMGAHLLQVEDFLRAQANDGPER